MNTWPSLLSLFLVWSVVVISPGPCFLATVQHAAAGTRRDGMLVALGIAAGTLLWCTTSLVGLAVLFARFSALYDALRVAGALYLVHLGVRTLRNARTPLVSAPVSGAVARRGWGHAVRLGFLTDISNPKAALFFSSLFAALLPPAAPLRVRVLAVALVIVVELVWYSLVLRPGDHDRHFAASVIYGCDGTQARDTR